MFFDGDEEEEIERMSKKKGIKEKKKCCLYRLRLILFKIFLFREGFFCLVERSVFFLIFWRMDDVGMLELLWEKLNIFKKEYEIMLS